MMHGGEKSDLAIVAVKRPNNAGRPAAEAVEPRAGTKGNAGQHNTLRTQIRAGVSQALDRVRNAARHRKKEQFTALLHHVSVETLQVAFYALKRKAAPGVDGMTWQQYEADLERRLADLHGRVHRGAYGNPKTERVRAVLAVGISRRLIATASGTPVQVAYWRRKSGRNSRTIVLALGTAQTLARYNFFTLSVPRQHHGSGQGLLPSG